jgi:hypothetical protein
LTVSLIAVVMDTEAGMNVVAVSNDRAVKIGQVVALDPSISRHRLAAAPLKTSTGVRRTRSAACASPGQPLVHVLDLNRHHAALVLLVG